MTKRVHLFFPLLLVMCSLLISPAIAQKNAKKQQPKEPEKPIINIEHEAIKGVQLDNRTDDEATFKLAKPSIDNSYDKFRSTPFKQLRNKYVKTSYLNLTKLYWKTDVLNLENKYDIDAYLLLTQCKNVGEIYGDDFKWNALRTKTQEYLKKNKEKFSKKMTFTQPLHLKEYNLVKQYFEIEKKYAYNKSRRFLISNNRRGQRDFCVRNIFQAEYLSYAPYNVVFSTKRAFTLEKLPVSKKLSRYYLEYLSKNQLPRIAYIKFYINLELFKETKYEPESKDKYINEYSGSIDYVEVYADEANTKLLYKIDLR